MGLVWLRYGSAPVQTSQYALTKLVLRQYMNKTNLMLSSQELKNGEKKKTRIFFFLSDFYSLYSLLTHYNFCHFETNVTFGDQWKVSASVFYIYVYIYIYVGWCCRWCTRRWRRGQPYPSRTSPATTSAQAALCSPCRANVGFLWGTGRLGLLGRPPQSTIMDHRIQPI